MQILSLSKLQLAIKTSSHKFASAAGDLLAVAQCVSLVTADMKEAKTGGGKMF